MVQLPVCVLLITVQEVNSKTHQETVLVSMYNNVTCRIAIKVPVACVAGCRACTGPNIVDCLACEDETRYRLTTNEASSSACVTIAECDDTAISAFGDRTCTINESVSLKCSY